ncbi:MAG TPA: hypothetical protein EYH34_12270 [Planctomycetes bacterium]|nr:hypothetical protein [Planctomycetota bacterium]
MGRMVFVWLVLLWAPLQAVSATVKITVEEPTGVARHGWPVTSGIPLSQGVLSDPSACALFSASGSEVPLQSEALARWPDGSVRWLLLDFQVDLAPGERKTFSLQCGPGVARGLLGRQLRVDGDGERVLVDTGPMRMELSASRFAPLGCIWLDRNGDGTFSADEQVLDLAGSLIALVDAQGRRFSVGGGKTAVDEMIVEQAGPLRACIRVSGHHTSDAGRMFRYVLRIHAFRGQPFLRLSYTFINDHEASLMAELDHIDLVLAPSQRSGPVTGYLLNGKWRDPSERHLLEQIDEQGFLLDGRPAGRRARGWAALGSQACGLAVGVREFWQNWPKALAVGGGRLVLGICPAFPQGRYDGKPLAEESKLYYYLRGGRYAFKAGVSKTHELWVTFFAGRPDAEKLAGFFQAAEDPLLATCDPAYVSSTKAAGEFPPADPKRYFGYDAWFDRALKAHLERRDEVREYGMLNYGDWYGERSVNWGNLEYDLAHGLFLQYLRTGDRRYYLRAEQAARHHIDVDVVHATSPHLKNPWGPPPRVGDIWLHCVGHTGGYYENAPLPVSRTYQMGHSTNFGHVWVCGDLDYYYLTGDRRAREVSLQIADAMVSHMPTRYGTHIRALGWPMILVLAAYEATGEKKYLDAATRNWEVLKEKIDWQRGWVVRLAGDHCRHGDRRCYGNVPFMEGLTCCALARYHRLTQDPEVLQALTAGIDQMIRECWQEDVKTFRYTACPLSSKTPYVLFMLSTEAMAYEVARTGDKEHLRILREGVRAAIPQDDSCHFGKCLAQMTFFTPHGLDALED